MGLGGNTSESAAKLFDNGSRSGFDSFAISRSSTSGIAIRLFGGFFDSRHAAYSPEFGINQSLDSDGTIEDFTETDIP